MLNIVIIEALQLVCSFLLGSGVIDRIEGAVSRWEDKAVSSAEKKEGVLAELEVIGIKLSGSVANFAIESAIQIMKQRKL